MCFGSSNSSFNTDERLTKSETVQIFPIIIVSRKELHLMILQFSMPSFDPFLREAIPTMTHTLRHWLECQTQLPPVIQCSRSGRNSIQYDGFHHLYDKQPATLFRPSMLAIILARNELALSAPEISAPHQSLPR